MDSSKMLSPIMTVSRVYSDVLKDKPTGYFDYDKYTPLTDSIDNYSLISKLGHGKYSFVFEAMNEVSKEKVVVKILKPVKSSKIRREIKILEHLKPGVNIVNLLAVVREPWFGTYALIFESTLTKKDFKDVHLRLKEPDIRFYMREILKALDYCHSRGIMHRDVKPQNMIIDERHHRIQLIDFGLAEYYRPKERYNIRVASRHYKSPELLIDYGYYDYSLDLWSLGCVFAAMLFRVSPFFNGTDNGNQLKQIVQILGSSALFVYVNRFQIDMHKDSVCLVLSASTKTKQDWQQFVTSENEHLVSVEALGLLDSLLLYDHTERISAREALDHKYFTRP